MLTWACWPKTPALHSAFPLSMRPVSWCKGEILRIVCLLKCHCMLCGFWCDKNSGLAIFLSCRHFHWKSALCSLEGSREVSSINISVSISYKWANRTLFSQKSFSTHFVCFCPILLNRDLLLNPECPFILNLWLRPLTINLSSTFVHFLLSVQRFCAVVHGADSDTSIEETEAQDG